MTETKSTLFQFNNSQRETTCEMNKEKEVPGLGWKIFSANLKGKAENNSQ